MRYIILLILVSLSYSEDPYCKTTESEPTQSQIAYWAGYSRTDWQPLLKVHIHLIKNSSGGGAHAVTTTESHIAINRVAKYFSDGDIYFSVDSITEIHSDSRYSGNIISWMNDNPHDDAIDIYLYPDNVYNGGSSDTVPSIHLIIGGEKDNTELVQSGVLAHEIGHCLGLYHTHRGYDGVSGACEETGPENCEDCGDFICDTPPDPGLFNRITEEYYVDSNCQFCCTEDTSTFDPDTYNTMSYTLPKCNSYFSEGQFDRVFATLDSVTVADSALIDTLGSYSSPSTPSGLSWSNLNGHPLLSWNIHPDIDVAGYDIFRKFNSGAWIKIGYSAGRVINHFYDSQIDIVSPKFPPGYVYYKK